MLVTKRDSICSRAHHLKEGILKDPRNRTYKENLTQARSSSEVKERTQDSFVEFTLAYIVEHEHGRKKTDAGDEDKPFREWIFERIISQKAREMIQADEEHGNEE